MDAEAFDPAGFFEFDGGSGEVHVRGGARVLVLSDAVLGPLVAAAVQGGDLTAVRRLGRHMGELVRGSLGNAPDALPAEAVLGRARAVLGLYGWGALEIERWGDALVARLGHAPVLDEDNLAMAALLGGLMSSLAQREVACVPVTPDGAFMMVEPHIAEEVWGWARAGESIARIVDRLAPEAA
jgi:hypothetical protein